MNVPGHNATFSANGAVSAQQPCNLYFLCWFRILSTTGQPFIGLVFNGILPVTRHTTCPALAGRPGGETSAENRYNRKLRTQRSRSLVPLFPFRPLY